MRLTHEGSWHKKGKFPARNRAKGEKALNRFCPVDSLTTVFDMLARPVSRLLERRPAKLVSTLLVGTSYRGKTIDAECEIARERQRPPGDITIIVAKTGRVITKIQQSF